MNLTPHFSYEELTRSQTAEKLGIENIPDLEQLANMKFLCETILEPLRSHFKKPVKITSCFRNQAVNIAVGGSDTSQHCKGEAVDCEIVGIPNNVIADWVSEHLLFDQIILEFYKPSEGINSGWVHISVRRNGTNRKSKLIALKNGKKTIYKQIGDFDPDNAFENFENG